MMLIFLANLGVYQKGSKWRDVFQHFLKKNIGAVTAIMK